MTRSAPFALGALVLLAAGCPGDPTPAEDGSSTGPGAESSSDGSSASSLDDTAGTTSTTTSPDTDDTTTGSSGSGHARFVVQVPIEGIDYQGELVLYEYADGELLPPLSLTPDLPEGSGAGSSVDASGAHLVYCVVDSVAATRPCFAVDVTTDPPGAAQPFMVAPVPATAQIEDRAWIEATQTFVFRARDLDDLANNQIYATSFVDGVLGTPQIVATPALDESLIGLSVSPDGTRVGYASGPQGGPQQAFVAALDVPDPGAAVMVSALAPPETVASMPRFVPGLDAVVYSADDDSPGPTDEALYFVDTSGAVPAAPIRIDDPLDDAQGVRGVQVAPDGHALLYWVGADFAGDLMLVDLSGGAPQLPVQVSSLGEAQTFVKDYGWSPDSRWVAYRAAHEQPETFDLYLVDASGDTPGDPMLVTGGLIPEGGVSVQLFDAQSQWLYYIAEQDSESSELFRVDVSGAEPGPPQRVSGPLSPTGWLPGEIIPSHDWSRVLYTAQDGAQELYLVDVSGPEPGEAVRINAPLAEGVDVRFGARFSFDDTVVLYGESGPGVDDPTPLRLVDLTDGTVITVTEDALGASPIID